MRKYTRLLPAALVLTGLLLTSCGRAAAHEKETGAAPVKNTPVPAAAVSAPEETAASVLPAAEPTGDQAGKFVLPYDEMAQPRFHLSPDGTLAGILSSKRLYVFHTSPFKPAYTIDTPAGAGNFAFSADGNLGAITPGTQQSVQLFDARSGTFTRVLEGGRLASNLLLFSGDGSKLAVVLDFSTVELWEAADGKYMGWLMIQGDSGKIGLNTNGEVLSKTGNLFYTRTGEPVPSDNWMHSQGTIFTPLGLCIRTVADLKPGFVVAHGPDFESPVPGISISPASAHLVVSSADEGLVAVANAKEVQIADVYAGKILKKDVIEVRGSDPSILILDIAFAADGTLIELVQESGQNEFAFYTREVKPRE